jgi:hypothetical protein
MGRAVHVSNLGALDTSLAFEVRTKATSDLLSVSRLFVSLTDCLRLTESKKDDAMVGMT